MRQLVITLMSVIDISDIYLYKHKLKPNHLYLCANRIFVILFVLLSVQFSLKSQNEFSDTIKSGVFIEPLKDRYYGHESIDIVLQNRTDSIVYFSASLQEKTGDEWHTIIFDVLRHKHELGNAKNVKLIMKQEGRYIDVDLRHLFILNYKPNGLCRFCFEIKASPISKGNNLYSSEFLID